MCDEEREPYSWDVVEIGLHVGDVRQLNSVRGRKNRNPIGFTAPKRRSRRNSAGRIAGSWPEVPFFDVVEEDS